MLTSRRKRLPPGRLAALCAAALLVAAAALWREPLAALLWQGLRPLAAARAALSSGEAAVARAELASSSARLADYDLLKQENEFLRKELNHRADSRTVVAGVLEGPPGTPYDTLVVDAGAAQGVVVGARVSAGGIGIGRIDAVYPGSARAVLYSAPGETYQAQVVARGSTLPLSIEGQGGGSLRGQVPALSDVRAGDSVAFPGLGGALAGIVSAVEAKPGESFKTVYLHLPVNLFELRYVSISL